MKKPGFPPSTIALVALMVGALFMVSKTVTPPPAAPPPVTPASATTETAAPSTDPGHGELGHKHGEHGDEKPGAAATKPDLKPQKNQREEIMAYNKKKLEEERQRKAIDQKAQDEVKKRMMVTNEDGVKPLKYDPSNNNIDSKFFTEMPMGEQGIELTDRAVAEAEVIKAQMRKAEIAAKAKNPKSEQPKQSAP